MSLTTYGGVAIGTEAYASTPLYPEVPTLKVEVAFVANPYGTIAASDWTDITSQVLSFKSKRGKNYELGKPDAGELGLELLNQDGRFDPTNTSSPYYPYVLSRRPIRITATYLGVTVGVYRGYVERWPQKWTNGLAGVSVKAVDGFKTVLGFQFGQRWDEWVPVIAPTDWWRFASGGGGAGLNAGSGGSYTPSTSGQTLTSVAALIAGSSNAATNASVGVGAGSTYTATVLHTSGAVWAVQFAMTATTGVSVQQQIAMLTNTLGGTSATAGCFEANVIVPAGGGTPYLAFTYYDSGGTPHTSSFPATTAPLNTAVSLAVTFASSGGTVTWSGYVNGTLIWTAVDASGVSPPDAATVGAFSKSGAGYTTIAWTVDEFIKANMTALQLATMYRYVLGTTPVWAEFAQEDTGARCGHVLDAVHWPSGDRVIDVGNTTVRATGSLTGTTALTALLSAATSELGRVFIDGSGRFVFQNRSHSIGSAVATFGENTAGGECPYEGDIVVEFDDTYVRNDIQVTKANSSPTYVAYASDQTSQSTYGSSTLQVTIDTITTADCDGMAATLLSRYKDEHPRVPELSLDGMGNPLLFTQMLTREIGDVVTVVRRPNGAPSLSFDCVIEGVEHDVARNKWVTTFLLSPKPAAATY